jgi:hypothetical protein
MEEGIKIEQLSAGTRDRLARYTQAIKQYEIETRKVYFRDGGHLEIPPTGRTIDQHSAAKRDLSNCPEQVVKELVHLIQIDRVDQAMAESELAVRRAVDEAKLAENELVYLGQQILDSENSTRNFGEGKCRTNRSRNPVRRRKSQFRLV